jgi:nitrate reductase NapAB chaperone NapD
MPDDPPMTPAAVAIRSYLIHPVAGRTREVAEALSALGHAVYPADNRDVLVLVVAHDSLDAQRDFDEQLNAMTDIAAVAFVSGYTE